MPANKYVKRRERREIFAALPPLKNLRSIGSDKIVKLQNCGGSDQIHTQFDRKYGGDSGERNGQQAFSEKCEQKRDGSSGNARPDGGCAEKNGGKNHDGKHTVRQVIQKRADVSAFDIFFKKQQSNCFCGVGNREHDETSHKHIGKGSVGIK